MSDNLLPRGKLIGMLSVRILGLIILLPAMFFLPAGTLDYWEAWVYMAVLLVPMGPVLIYLLRNDPKLLERRMRMKEKEAEQRSIINVSILYFLLAFLLPGFDKRFGWSDVPVAVVIAADLLVLLGYGIIFLVFRENRYASRIIEVEQGQQVVTSGPYSVIRHPMYAGALLMYGLSPLALGSYWAMIVSLWIVPILVARIRNEEDFLQRELEGYREYMQVTKYRLVPGIW